jgi:hypothetical protein
LGKQPITIKTVTGAGATMWIIELIIGIILIAMAFVMLRIARAKDGVLPPFLLVRGARPIYTWGVLLGIFVGATFVVHSVLAN